MNFYKEIPVQKKKFSFEDPWSKSFFFLYCNERYLDLMKKMYPFKLLPGGDSAAEPIYDGGVGWAVL